MEEGEGRRWRREIARRSSAERSRGLSSHLFQRRGLYRGSDQPDICLLNEKFWRCLTHHAVFVLPDARSRSRAIRRPGKHKAAMAGPRNGTLIGLFSTEKRVPTGIDPGKAAKAQGFDTGASAASVFAQFVCPTYGTPCNCGYVGDFLYLCICNSTLER